VPDLFTAIRRSLLDKEVTVFQYEDTRLISSLQCSECTTIFLGDSFLRCTEKTFLFDTGTKGKPLLENIEKLKTNSRDVEVVVI